MPTYEYACSACGNQWEELQKISEPALENCPKCAEKTAKRLISGGSFILKGGGWYADLYSSKPAKSGGGGEAGSDSGTPSKEGGSGDSAPSTPTKKGDAPVSPATAAAPATPTTKAAPATSGGTSGGPSGGNRSGGSSST